MLICTLHRILCTGFEVVWLAITCRWKLPVHTKYFNPDDVGQ